MVIRVNALSISYKKKFGSTQAKVHVLFLLFKKKK